MNTDPSIPVIWGDKQEKLILQYNEIALSPLEIVSGIVKKLWGFWFFFFSNFDKYYLKIFQVTDK